MRRTGARIRRHEAVAATALGRYVRERRRELGLSQDRLCEIANLRQEWLSRLELGEITMPEDEKVVRLSRVLEVELGVLLKLRSEVKEQAMSQLAQVWAVSSNPAADLHEIVPYLERDQITTLVQIARVMATGKALADGEG